YTIERTWSLIDNCGNAALDQIQTITIRDNTPPTFTRPIDVTIYTDASCSYDITVLNTGDVSDESDNCSTGLEATYVDAAPVAIAGCEGGYTIERTWSLIDNCGNAALDQIQTITIRDNTPPTFTVPVEVTICRDISGNYDRDPSNTGDVTDEADNCSIGLNAIYGDSDTAMGNVAAVGYITRTWTLSDYCGNTTVQTQIIWVQPVPKISVEVPDTLYCNGSTINFTIDSLVVSRGEVMYNLDVTYPAGVTGLLFDGPNQIINISDQLTNTTSIYQTVTYRFMPYIQGKPGDPICLNGRDTTIVIHIQPTARVAGSIVNDVLCNGDNVSISWTSPTTPYSGKEFNITVVNDYPEITGYSDQTGLTDI
ncbi:MAG: gliding motility-associated C-terminal domain-containing protein, partial [Bacteroidales bacterium]|nr:gliding motility-associated C-terminal domain-containing protein [Bacteroidales bacterium]